MTIQTSFVSPVTIDGLSDVKRYKDDWFGSRLKQAREAIQISQEQLAERLDVSRLTVVRWENGLLQPGFRRLRPIAQATGKPLSWFFMEPGENDDACRIMFADLDRRLSQIETAFEKWPDLIAQSVARLLAP